jgi:hypothetical protein
MKRLALVVFSFASIAACETPSSAPTTQAPSVPRPFATVLFNERVPVAPPDFQLNSCPPEEDVILNGFLHRLVIEQVGPTSQQITFHVNAQGIEGVGSVSGDRYSVPANSKQEITFTAVPETVSDEFELRFRLIREGSLDNLWLRYTATITFPPGTLDERLEIECRG